MTIEQSGFGVAPVDRSSALLTELQSVCQRILSDDDNASLAPTLIATANGSAVASSLEALRRQCVDNNQQVDALKRSVDSLRGVVAGDSADTAKMLVELRRAVDTMIEVVDRENQQVAGLVTSVETLRVGLAGASAGNRQQMSELRGSLDSVECAVSTVGDQVDTSLAGISQQVDSSLAGMGQKVDTSLAGVGKQVDTSLAGVGTQVDASLAGMGRQIEAALSGMAGQVEAAFTTMARQIQEAFNAFGRQVGQQMGHQSEAFDSLLEELRPQRTRERLDELESLLAVGLPKFSEEIQAGVQQTLMEVSRTFMLAEREHGNRMSELHRDFSATARRLETAMQPRRREESTK